LTAIAPIKQASYAQVLQLSAGSVAEGQPFALASSPASKAPAAKERRQALFFADGRIKGTLGGGCLEAEIQDRAAARC